LTELLNPNETRNKKKEKGHKGAEPFLWLTDTMEREGGFPATPNPVTHATSERERKKKREREDGRWRRRRRHPDACASATSSPPAGDHHSERREIERERRKGDWSGTTAVATPH